MVQAPQNETKKHGLAAAVEAGPERPDWTIDQGWANYTAEEHAVWKTLFERQTRLLPGRACDEFVEGMRALPIGADEIPDFRRLSEVLMQRTGWQVVAVPGLVPDEVFFEHLANRRFPSGNFIRKASQLAPDDASITDSLGWAQFKRGKTDDAIGTLQRAAEKDPDQAEIQEHLGDALFKSGRRFEARFAWAASLVTAEDDVAARVKAKLASGLTPANAAP